MLVLAIKPQTLEEAAAVINRLVGPDTLVVSILAGKTIADLPAVPGARAVVRAMPNLPASIGRGATGAAASPEVSDGQRDGGRPARSIGIVEWLDART